MIIRFKNWEKYNGRNDIKTFTWFRMSNSFLQDPKIFALEIEEVYAMLYLLCEASKSGKKGEAFINRDHARNTSRVESRVLDRTIKKLKSLQLLEVRTLRGCYAELSTTDNTDTTNKQTNKQLPDSAFAEPRRVFDFESLYKKYPRKEGKQRGIAVCQAQIRSQEDFAALSLAIDRYTAHVKKTAMEPKYIKHFSSFMGGWRDWLEADAGTVLKAEAEEPEWKRLIREQEAKNAAS